MKSRVNCGAFNCSNSYYKESTVSLHRFPKNPEKCKLWIRNSGLKSLINKTPDELVHSVRTGINLSPNPKKFSGRPKFSEEKIHNIQKLVKMKNYYLNLIKNKHYFT